MAIEILNNNSGGGNVIAKTTIGDTTMVLSDSKWTPKGSNTEYRMLRVDGKGRGTSLNPYVALAILANAQKVLDYFKSTGAIGESTTLEDVAKLGS